jgi:hypothetical protein
MPNKLVDYVEAFLIGCVGSLIVVLATIGGLYASKDSADDVMKACNDTGMYLHKGYAINCHVLINGPHDAKDLKL